MSDNPFRPEGGRHHVVVIGSGFGGLFAVQNLKDADVDITLIDRTNHHLFQPLLYQVATGILSSGEIAPQTRQVLLKQDNVNVVKAEVTDINTSAKTVSASLGEYSKTIEYDSLIVAAGAGQSYFGNDHFAQHAPGMKTIDDALELRARILGAFERAEICDDPVERDRLLTFVIVGAGPTGVELAGQLAEMAHRTLAGEYTRFNPANAKIILIDGAPQILPPFGKRLGRNAQRELEKIGVTVKLNAIVTDLDEDSVTYKSTTDNSTHTINSFCKIWSAGVAASPLGKVLADQLEVEVDRAGRVPVNPDLSVGSDKNVFVIGDMMSLNNLPGVAQTAIQGGAYVAEQIAAEVEGRSADEREPFEYYDKGSMATVSRFNAVVKLGKVEVTGFIGWAMWLCVHLMFLVGFRNRATAAFSWGINALSRKRWNLATTRQQLHARGALAEQDKNLETKN
ncbi:NAD(P)/FAD-dependent oxidoreductase [Corynebacterium pseudotuberculosis]|uniref:NADH:ubiquinone reductase (non-electrogenic) n=3 Tax=Bacteria TaxID=2 RepID=D9QAA9_CORP2|nr:NAD(P)/FAD-dependent oxidoreductase [Corynebacterium pseudotuberculosis]AER69061.1 NADH dehydrogenase [Corynebacterium pseudotuberculosis 1/06-A]ADK28808.1 NAD(P)/FAD-dependent oxidoreductase [Corynebacterium pseudotuberculosis FRC41]ADL10485.1 FAD-dependent oxidoreductase [Corynebacterium pseudotuberculosis C231]ADL20894.1 NAD(P)/FAD-dependent oxidoreductase [Corynebacterium pseudotuberculosis 1002]ADO26282.1 NAD(P)/FAD-dependent oxidoreductase [Corynebacterium pseudotuberculosis I19]